MTKRERAHFERRLLRERERALRMLARFDERAKVPIQEDTGELSLYSQHPADEGTETIEREKTFLLASQEGRLVYRIDDALRTLYKEPERYGRCQNCGRDIALERLDIVPWARFCVDCQRDEEQNMGAAA